MKHAALVDADGIVDNLIVLEDDYLDDGNPSTSYTPPDGFELVEVPDELLEPPAVDEVDEDYEGPPVLSLGWHWDGESFTPPEPPPVDDDRVRLGELRAKALDPDDGKLSRAELEEAVLLALRTGAL